MLLLRCLSRFPETFLERHFRLSRPFLPLGNPYLIRPAHPEPHARQPLTEYRSHPHPKKTRSIRTYKRTVPQSVWRTDRYGITLYFISFCDHVRPLHDAPPNHRRTAGSRKRRCHHPLYRTDHSILSVARLFIRRNLLLFRKRAGTDLLPKPGRRHLFTDPGIPLSFPLSHRHSDRDPERPGTHRPMPDPKPRRPWNPNPLRDLRNPPHGNPRLPLRTAFKPAYHNGIKPDLFT